MTLFKKQSAMTKIVTHSGVALVSLVLVYSIANPMVAQAVPQATLPGIPFTFETSTPSSVTSTTQATNPVEAPTSTPVPDVAEEKQYVVKYTKNVVATAYSSEAAQTDSTPCIPAMWKFDLCENFAKTGIEDTIADNSLKLGTVVRFKELPGRTFVVRDRMNSKYNGKPRIDFWMSSKSAAIKFGAQKMTMEVLQEVKPVEKLAEVAGQVK